ncbi:MAG TPA: c-type cytochrome domain-containing protein [Verrucomicrobiales bacterium]|nr:c-type cytochrome domain-containing protein [Verrucomicrobiales bacterium]
MRIPFFSVLTLSASIACAAPTYNDDILPVFKNNCTGCHNPDKLKADLDLTTYATTMKGGSSGAAVKAGAPDSSLVYRVTMHLEEPEMPPKKPKLADAQLNLIKEWIAGGALETKGGAPAKSRDAALAMSLPAADAKLDGPPPMPQNLPPAANAEVFSRPAPVIALAASPRAPLAAVSSHAQVLLYNTETKALIGALPFPERQPNVLHFSRDGSVLLAAGGRGAHSGKAVVFDIKTGQRVAEAGAETSDAILAADLSPDRSLIATGGGDKIIRIYSTKDGKLQRTIKKHTDWVTALAFSPDGEKLATADRNGGLHLWDPRTGTILYTLAEHQARITSLAWRGDSLILASAGDDGKLILWDTAEGWAAKSMTPADGSKKDRPGRKTMLLKVPGVLSAEFASDGRLAATCRDNAVRVYNGNSNPVAVIKDLPDIPTAAVFTKPSGQLLTGDFRGVLQLWDLQEKQKKAVPAGELGK